jgi:ATP-binding cassette subfamily B protein
MLTRLLRTFTRPYLGTIIIVLSITVFQTWINLSLPSLNADLINQGVAQGDTEYVLQVGSQMLGLSVVLVAVSVVAVYLASKVAMSIARDLRSAIFDKVLRLSPYEMDLFGTPSLITRNTNDVQQVQMLLTVGLTMLASAPITVVGGVIMAIHHNAKLSILIAVAVPLMAGVIGVVMSKAVPEFRKVQKRIDRINGVFREQITGMRVIRAFTRDDFEKERFATANMDLMTTQLGINRLFAFAMPGLILILNLASVGVVWFGGKLVDNNEMQIGDLTAFISYLMQILGSVMMATMMLILIPRAAASAERIKEVLDHTLIIHDPADPQPQGNQGRVRFNDVTYYYPGAEEPVLRNLSFQLVPGQLTAVVGSTGSGKTTLVNLLMRFVDATSGTVYINDVDVKQQLVDDVWGAVGLVPQRPYLFQGSVRETIQFGRDISDDDVWAALEIAQAADFIRELPEGLDAHVAQGGTNFSGGQRQRLAIARAIARKSSIYVFDDSFSALDAATDARLRNALLEHTRESTVLLVAQRVSSVISAHRIIVLDEGHIVGMGTHHELLQTCATYQEIVASQQTAEALS